jgi:hypothetical protein
MTSYSSPYQNAPTSGESVAGVMVEDPSEDRDDGVVELLQPATSGSKKIAPFLAAAVIVIGGVLLVTTQTRNSFSNSFLFAAHPSFGTSTSGGDEAIVVPWGIYKHTTSLPCNGADAAKEWLMNYLTGLTDQYTLGCYPSSKVVGEIVFVVALLLRCTCCTVTAIVVSTKRPLTLFPNFSSTRKAATS